MGGIHLLPADFCEKKKCNNRKDPHRDRNQLYFEAIKQLLY